MSLNKSVLAWGVIVAGAAVATAWDPAWITSPALLALVGMGLVGKCIRSWLRPWLKTWCGVSLPACVMAMIVFAESELATDIGLLGAVMHAVLLYHETKRTRAAGA